MTKAKFDRMVKDFTLEPQKAGITWSEYMRVIDRAKPRVDVGLIDGGTIRLCIDLGYSTKETADKMASITGRAISPKHVLKIRKKMGV